MSEHVFYHGCALCKNAHTRLLEDIEAFHNKRFVIRQLHETGVISEGEMYDRIDELRENTKFNITLKPDLSLDGFFLGFHLDY